MLQNPRRQLKAGFAVLTELRVEVPEVEDRNFIDGRTKMRAWLLPFFVRRM